MASFYVSMFMVFFMIPAVSGVKMMRKERERKGEAGRAGKGEEISVITMEYGGTSHGDTPHNDNVLARPEAVRSQTCNNGACQDCTSRASCWHGVEMSDWGYMELNVAAGASFTHYIAEVWAKCSTSVGTWYFKAWELVNGEVVLARNGVELHRTSQPDKHYQNLGLPTNANGQARMRVSFAHTDKTKAAKCRFYLEAYHVDQSVDTCMSAKECCSKLGDGSEEAYELRNGNSMQMRCLKGERSTMTAALRAKCEEWDGCVEGTGKKVRLLALLKAASAPKPGSLITGLVTENKTRDSDNSDCVHPAVDDPESWDCECAEEMFGKCSSSSDVEGCLQGLMCSNSNVCGSWKQEHCASTSSSLMDRRGAKNVMTNGINNNLDGTTQGKCSD
jgi:hypothetical protein